MTLTVGILFAFVCALATNLGFLFKHRGASRCPPVALGRPLTSAKALFSSRWFTLGMLIATVAWGFHVAALALAPLSIVRAVLAAGVVLLAVMAERLFGSEVGPRQWWGVLLTAAGLVLLVLTLPSIGGAHSTSRAPR